MIKTAIEVSPNMVNFGTIERTAEAQKKTFKITKADGGPITPELLPIKDENVKTTLREIKAGEEYELDVEVVPPWPNKTVQGYVQLKTGVAESPNDRLRYYARISPRLSAAPNRISVPKDLASDLHTRVRLNWSGNKPGKVLDATPSNPKISAKYLEEGGQQYIEVIVPKDYKVPRGNTFVKVTTDDPVVPDLRIQIVPRHTSATTAKPRKSGVSGGNKPILRPRPGLAKPTAQSPTPKTKVKPAGATSDAAPSADSGKSKAGVKPKP